MPTENLSDPPDEYGFVRNWRVKNWRSSDRDPKGKLILRNNPFQLLAGRIVHTRFERGYQSHLAKRAPNGSDIPYQVLNLLRISKLEEQCYSKMRGKLYWGSASLGVTLASAKQAREMIVDRYAFLNRRCTAIAADLFRVDGSRRYPKTRHAEKVAGFHLEVIFGWTPLLQDIHKAVYEVTQFADEHEFISVSARSMAETQFSTIDYYVAEARVAYSAGVRITNPNRWLAERAGLLNPATVIWDLVPWSFVVNMFVNTGQLVQQVTDFAGLSFDDMHKTTSVRYRWVRATAQARGSYRGTDIRRTPSALPPTPGLTFRLPEANWGTAAMAASLFTQRFSKLAGLVRPGLRGRSEYTE